MIEWMGCMYERERERGGVDWMNGDGLFGGGMEGSGGTWLVRCKGNANTIYARRGFATYTSPSVSLPFLFLHPPLPLLLISL